MMPALTRYDQGTKVARRCANTPGRGRPLLGGIDVVDSTCSIDGCGGTVNARGWCGMHYRRWRLNGDPGPAAPMRIFGGRLIDGRKLCVTCREEKPASEFTRNTKATDGLQSNCKPCRAVYRLGRKYGITLAERQAMEAEQDGACAICGVAPAGGLCVDHCHDSGAVRELLCVSCNNAIGLLGDDPERALAAVTYLRKWAYLKEADSRGA